jgi:hypothetical protein
MKPRPREGAFPIKGRAAVQDIALALAATQPKR